MLKDLLQKNETINFITTNGTFLTNYTQNYLGAPSPRSGSFCGRYIPNIELGKKYLIDLTQLRSWYDKKELIDYDINLFVPSKMSGFREIIFTEVILEQYERRISYTAQIAGLTDIPRIAIVFKDDNFYTTQTTIHCYNKKGEETQCFRGRFSVCTDTEYRQTIFTDENMYDKFIASYDLLKLSLISKYYKLRRVDNKYYLPFCQWNGVEPIAYMPMQLEFTKIKITKDNDFFINSTYKKVKKDGCTTNYKRWESIEDICCDFYENEREDVNGNEFYFTPTECKENNTIKVVRFEEENKKVTIVKQTIKLIINNEVKEFDLADKDKIIEYISKA